jgi:hypothetical protein
MVKYMLAGLLAAITVVGGIAKAEAILGVSQNAGMPGLVKIARPGGTPFLTQGFLVSQNLVLTSK